MFHTKAKTEIRKKESPRTLALRKSNKMYKLLKIKEMCILKIL